MPVVGERDLGAGEAERMQVRRADDLALAVGDATDVSDEAGRLKLPASARRFGSNAGRVVVR